MIADEILGVEFERAMRFLTKHMPISDENSKKPELFHSLRVGVYLYEEGYSKEMILSGVLHDIIEDSRVDEEMLRKEFGDEVTILVLACTKNESIVDKKQKIKELIGRCVDNGQDALIVKTADILDSFKWYARQKNDEQLLYCLRNAEAIFNLKPRVFEDKIFDELKIWKDKLGYLLA